MRTIKGLMATTHLDLHNERLALSALEGMVEQISRHYIPAMVNHDPRYPPYGRVIDATIVPLADGEYGLEVTTELIEGTKAAPGDGRTIAVDVDEISKFIVGYDRTIAANDPERDVAALAVLSGAPAVERGKKALEPIGELVLQVGLLGLGSIAAGFLAKVGADAWDELKRILMRRYRAGRRDELLEIVVGLDVGYPSQVVVIIEHPRATELRIFFDAPLREVDGLVLSAIEKEGELARVVFLWKEGVPRLLYAVRRDGVPVLVDWSLVPPPPGDFRTD